MDGVIATVYMNSILDMVATVSGFAAKKVEDEKVKLGENSAHLVTVVHGGRHTFVPFTMEDGGRIGAHGQAALRMLAEHTLAKGRHLPRPRRAAPLSPHVAVSPWLRR